MCGKIFGTISRNKRKISAYRMERCCITMADHKTIHEIYGALLFDRRAMKERLNPEVYAQVLSSLDGRERLSPEAADIVAGAMKDWAISKGATHWAH